MERLLRLVHNRGDVGRILALPRDDDGYLDLSGEAWGDASLVLTGLDFIRLRLADVNISPNFVNCRFEDCVFERVRSDQRFWGANDTWTRCTFRDTKLRGMIAPENRFVECNFERVKLIAFTPFSTIFDECRLQEVTFEGFKASGDTAFRQCSLTQPVLKNCDFALTRFENCDVRGPSIENSTFAGAISTPTEWWCPGDSTPDPFRRLVLDVLDLVRTQLGENHQLVQRVQAFLARYDAKQATNLELGETIFQPDIPPRDLRRIEKKFFKLLEEHGQ